MYIRRSISLCLLLYMTLMWVNLNYSEISWAQCGVITLNSLSSVLKLGATEIESETFGIHVWQGIAELRKLGTNLDQRFRPRLCKHVMQKNRCYYVFVSDQLTSRTNYMISERTTFLFQNGAQWRLGGFQPDGTRYLIGAQNSCCKFLDALWSFLEGPECITVFWISPMIA